MIIKAPEPLPFPLPYPAIFLAGSTATVAHPPWRPEMEKRLGWAVTLDPYRADWDETWNEDPADPRFREQVQWELNGLARADLILFWFEPGTESPISLLEFGLYAPSGKIIVGCNRYFWKYGNVFITAQRYNVPVVDSLSALADRAAERFGLA